MKKKRVRGYISSRKIKGQLIPQKVQNLVIRDYCKNKNLLYLLSSVEYKMKNSFLMFQEILKELKLIDGIVAYSIFQLPNDENLRKKIISIILKKSKFIYFALENLELNKKSEIENLETIFKINQLIEYSPQNFEI